MYKSGRCQPASAPRGGGGRGSGDGGRIETAPRRKTVCDNHLRHTSYPPLPLHPPPSTAPRDPSLARHSSTSHDWLRAPAPAPAPAPTRPSPMLASPPTSTTTSTSSASTWHSIRASLPCMTAMLAMTVCPGRGQGARRPCTVTRHTPPLCSVESQGEITVRVKTASFLA